MLIVVHRAPDKLDRDCYRIYSAGPQSPRGGPVPIFYSSRAIQRDKRPVRSSRRIYERLATMQRFNRSHASTVCAPPKAGIRSLDLTNESPRSISTREQSFVRRLVLRRLRNPTPRNSAGKNRDGAAHRCRTGGGLFYRPPISSTRFEILGLRATAGSAVERSAVGGVK